MYLLQAMHDISCNQHQLESSSDYTHVFHMMEFDQLVRLIQQRLEHNSSSYQFASH